MTATKAYAAHSATSGVAPFSLNRRALRPDDVAIEIDYCGVCHTDIHFVQNDLGNTIYPVVPGHEIVGRVTQVGEKVSAFRPGDVVGVGCMVDSCRTCAPCQAGLQQYCQFNFTATYNDHDRVDQQVTYGGYSDKIVVNEGYVLKIPEKLDAASAAPILCAGITTYSPLRHLKVGRGHKVGVLGMGGLGHMGVKFAKALGAEVTVFTRSANKVEEAKRHGADHAVVSTNPDHMAAAAETFDFLLDTIPVPHDLNPYLACLKTDGVHILVGLLEPMDPPIQAGQLIFRRRSIIGSLIGGIPETQEVLDFCAEHSISCDVEMLDIQNINAAYERMKRGDVKYRFVIDMASLKK